MKIDEPKTHGEAVKVLKHYKIECPGNLDPFPIAKAILKAQADGMNKPGECETCRFISWDGELGTIQCCEHDDVTFRDEEGIEIEDSIFPWGECPKWESNFGPGYCQKHKRWFFNDWEKACPECFAEYEAHEREQSMIDESRRQLYKKYGMLG